MHITLDDANAHVTMGYIREDGDFSVITTINNHDGHFSEASLIGMIADMIKHILELGEKPYVIINDTCLYSKEGEKLKVSKSVKIDTSMLQIDYLEVSHD